MVIVVILVVRYYVGVSLVLVWMCRLMRFGVMRCLDDENNGMYNQIEKNIPNRELVMKHLGWIYDGELSPQDWEDSTVTYLLESNENGTLLIAKVNALDEFVDFFNAKYPSNFEKVKKLSES